ncbi:MAG: hypothetical protein F6K56_06540 [Moorea sp. SIO3G5]|nr:hypothetical protein [Moorena sp. SIO3G5]
MSIVKIKSTDKYIDTSTLLQQLVVIGSPFTLGLLEIWHPTGSPGQTAFEAILPQVDWWLTLHILQLPLFGLMALSVVILVNNLQGWAARISRVGIAFFIVFYTALDSITGIASGLLIRTAKELPPQVQTFVSQQVNLFLTDPIVGGATFSLVGILGALGWLVGVSAAAIALRRVGVPRLPVVLLILSGVFFGLSHTPPTGPLGMGCFFLAVFLISFPEAKLKSIRLHKKGMQ